MAPSLPAFDFSQTTDYQGSAQRNLNICLIVFSVVLVCARLYVRAFMTKGLGLDDAITVVAAVMLVVFSGLELRAVGLGSGAHMDQTPEYFIPSFFEALTTQHLMYFWCVGLMRLAVIAFILRLAQDRLFRTMTLATGAVILTQTIVCFLYRLLECKNIVDLWKPPGTGNCVSKENEAIMMWAHAGIGIVVDVALFCLPIWVVRSRMMNAAKAFRVVLIFCIGIFVVITGIVRLVILVRTNFAVDTTYKMATVAFWSDLEGHVGLWCACFPALQPLVRFLSFRCGLRSKLESSNPYGGKPSGYVNFGRSGGTGNNTGLRSRVSNNGYLRSGTGFDGTSDNFSDSNSQRGIVSEARAAGAMEMDRMGDLPKHGEIKRMREVTVQVDARTPDHVADKA